jgi:hypothetical protein
VAAEVVEQCTEMISHNHHGMARNRAMSRWLTSAVAMESNAVPESKKHRY